jgi:hypothetical protein
MLQALERSMSRASNHRKVSPAGLRAEEGLLTARLGLEGALLAVASLGTVAWIFGFQQHILSDVVAAGTGFIGVILARVLTRKNR